MARRKIAGLRAIVTGASSGIGRALTLSLVGEGARVVAIARREDRLLELKKQVHGAGSLEIVAGDVTDAEVRTAAIDLCCREFGGLDVLVNNAGIGAHGPFAENDEARLRQLMEVNLFAPAEFIRQALPQLRTGRRPMIVNVGSVLGHTAVPGRSEYCASKFALHGLSDALRIELGREGIDVLLVSPSTTSTEFFDRALGETGKRTRRGMSSDAVAHRIVSAMKSGRREIILSAGGKALVWLDRLCPSLASYLIARFG